MNKILLLIVLTIIPLGYSQNIYGKGNTIVTLQGMEGQDFSLRVVPFGKTRYLISQSVIKELPLLCYGFDVSLEESGSLEEYEEQVASGRSLISDIKIKTFQTVIVIATKFTGKYDGLFVDMFKKLQLGESSLYDAITEGYKKKYQETRSPQEMIPVMLLFHPEFLYEAPLFSYQNNRYNLRTILKDGLKNRLSLAQAHTVNNFLVAGVYSYKAFNKASLTERPGLISNALQAYLNGFICLLYELRSVYGDKFFYSKVLEPVWSIKLKRNVDIIPLTRLKCTIVKAQIAERKANGNRWDRRFGNRVAPETYFVFYINIKDDWHSYFQSDEQKNELSPVWNKEIDGFVPDGSFKIIVYDGDTARADDIIGSKVFADDSKIYGNHTFDQVEELIIRK